jgi:putative hemolysin
MWGFELAIIGAMIAINSVFAAYEIALASVTVAQLKRLADAHSREAKVALYMKQNMEASLAVVQLGITLVGAVAAAVGGAGAGEMLAPVILAKLGVSARVAEVLAVVVVVIPLTVATLIVGELIPKVFALRNAEWVCLTLSPAMRLFSRSVWPAVWLFETIVIRVMAWGERRLGQGDDAKPETVELQDLRASALLARTSRLIGQRQVGIILGATEMQSRRVSDIMLPVEDISTLDVNSSLADSLIAAHLDMHTRFPVVEQKGDPQTIVGYANVKDIIAMMRHDPKGRALRAIVRSMPSFQADQPIAQCLERLITEHTHIALIRGAENRVLGMITLEDIIEDLLGDIGDEFDRIPPHIIAAGSSWIVGGGASLDRVKAATGIALSSDGSAAGSQTLSDWIVEQLGREARGGDIVETGAARVMVRKILRKRVQEAHVSGSGHERSAE